MSRCHAELSHGCEFCRCFDSFGYDLGTELVGEFDHCRAERVLAWVSIDARDEAPVQFDNVGRSRRTWRMEAKPDPASSTARRSVNSRTILSAAGPDRSRSAGSLGSRHVSGETLPRHKRARGARQPCAERPPRWRIQVLHGGRRGWLRSTTAQGAPAVVAREPCQRFDAEHGSGGELVGGLEVGEDQSALNGAVEPFSDAVLEDCPHCLGG